MGPSKRSDIIDRPVGLRRAADAAPSHVENVQRGCVGCRAALRTMAHSFDRYNTEPSRSCKLCALGRTAQRLSVCCRVATQHQLGHLRRGSARRAGPSPGCLSTRGKAPALPGWLLGGALSLYESQSKSNRQRPGQSDLARRLVARIELADTDDEPGRL